MKVLYAAPLLLLLLVTYFVFTTFTPGGQNLPNLFFVISILGGFTIFMAVLNVFDMEDQLDGGLDKNIKSIAIDVAALTVVTAMPMLICLLILYGLEFVFYVFGIEN